MNALPHLDCACASARRAARLVTLLYAGEIGTPEPSQYALLSALKLHPGISQTALAAALGYDKTTLSRSLRLLGKQGWIEPQATGTDARRRGYRLSAQGESVLGAATPGWQRAQDRLRSALGDEGWRKVFEAFKLLSDVSRGRSQPGPQPEV